MNDPFRSARHRARRQSRLPATAVSSSIERPPIRCFKVMPSRYSMTMNAWPSCVADFVDGADIRMVQGRSRLRLRAGIGPEPLRVFGYFVRRNLRATKRPSACPRPCTPRPFRRCRAFQRCGSGKSCVRRVEKIRALARMLCCAQRQVNLEGRSADHCSFAYSALASFSMGMSGFGVFPEGEEILISCFRFGSVAGETIGTSEPRDEPAHRAGKFTTMPRWSRSFWNSLAAAVPLCATRYAWPRR